MIRQEQFDKLEQEYGCGYWNVCGEHACPCAITVEDKGLQEGIYNSLLEESRKVADSFEDEFDDFYGLGPDDYEDAEDWEGSVEED